MKYRIEKIIIRNYRSVSKLDIDNKSNFLIFCGANNVGKTNLLRALNLFFADNILDFDPENDIPFHIYSGTRGAGNKVTLKVHFIEISTNEKTEIEKIFTSIEGKKELKINAKHNGNVLTAKDAAEFLLNFHYVFIEASNVDLPKLIASVVNDDILPIGLDRRRGQNQKESLKKLEEFITLSKKAVGKIESDMTKILVKFLQNVDFIDTTDWKLRIMFPEYSYLREAISNMITFTLYDSNDRQLDAKGSGIQRLILLSLINYIKTNSKKDVIWAIDEPEVFLQPGLQKGLFHELQEIAAENQIIIATHSHFFVKINDLTNTNLLIGTKELKEYTRKPGIHYYKINTERLLLPENELTQSIKKHLGIEKNDSWEIQPFNVVVEGKEDLDYFQSVMRGCELSIPNMIAGYGVDKYSGLFIWIEEYCSELSFRPKVLAIFDRDGNGRQKYDGFKNKRYKNFDLEVKYVHRYDGETFNDIELEDFIIPEILFQAVNKFLRKKGYKIIGQRIQNKRNLPAYNKIPVLQFISDMVKQANEDKPALDFNDQGLKYVLSENTIKVIEKHTGFKKEIGKYPKVLDFLKSLTA